VVDQDTIPLRRYSRWAAWGGAQGSRKASIVRALHEGYQVMNCSVDVWDMTVARPGDGTVSERVVPRRFASTGSFVPRWEESPGMSIVRVLDEPTDQTLIVSWRDARSGYYGYPDPARSCRKGARHLCADRPAN
jgi:hypothetical protein